MADQLGGASGNATAADLLSGYTASVASGPITGTIPNKSGPDVGAAATVTTGTTLIKVKPQQGYYDGNTNVTTADSNLVATNILSGINIFGVAGSVKPTNYASGTTTSPISNNTNFRSWTGGLSSSYYVTVSGLSFTAKVIVVVYQSTTSATNLYATIYMEKPFSQSYSTSNIVVLTGSTPVTYELDGTAAYVNSSGFQLPFGNQSESVYWYAWG